MIKLQNNRAKYQIQQSIKLCFLGQIEYSFFQQQGIVSSVNRRKQFKIINGSQKHRQAQNLIQFLIKAYQNLNNFYSINCRQLFNSQNDTQLRIFDTKYNKYQHFLVVFRIQFTFKRFVFLRLLQNSQYLCAQKINQLFGILMIY
ncbi:unnamed protein product [Paramecium primaurelia]|uniref:Uncharacterized protein n=1 Tax=Paramecium primaurelia TaxID=5886 RepID=A0A8S1LCP9_PARPR|nr:unnamed protein product [Paramecium primaurelia]